MILFYVVKCDLSILKGKVVDHTIEEYDSCALHKSHSISKTIKIWMLPTQYMI